MHFEWDMSNFVVISLLPGVESYYKADSRLASNQWETALLCNDVSRSLGANLESALY